MSALALSNHRRFLASASALLLFAAPVAVQGQFSYITNKGAITITGYTGSGGAVNIPAQINGLPVTSIGDSAFSLESSLTSVAIPDGVTNIGSFAFGGCSALTAITVAAQNPAYSSLAGILFDKNQTRLIQFPPGLGGSYTIPSSVTSVGDDAFFSCGHLTSVTIPNSVTSVGDAAFEGCERLTNINIGNSVTTIGNDAFSDCSGLPSVTIPDSVTAIGDGVFADCYNLSNVTLGNSVTTIGQGAFYNCSLTSVTIPASVTNIGISIFYECYRLTNITVAVQNPAYSSLAGVLFDKNQTTLIQFPPGLGGSYTLPESVTSVEVDAFTSCGGLSSVTTGNNVISIGDEAFAFCYGLTNVTLGSSVNIIGHLAFLDCSLTSLTVPNAVTNIGNSAFGDCFRLTAITVAAQNPVYSSLNGVLFDRSQTELIDFPCGLVGSYTVPDTVTSIGDWAFGDCDGLTSIFFTGNAPTAGLNSFADGFGIDPATAYYLPGTTGWSNTFAGLPTALWLPKLQAADGGFGVRSNRFGFNLTWASGQTVVVEAATNLSSPVWVPVATNVLTTGTTYFNDAAWTNFPQRFYRAVQP